jgi:hypothetical protein
MLIEFDQNTMANMTAALEYVCKKIPADKDNHDTRKRIADAMIACAKTGRRNYVDFQNAGFRSLDDITRPARFDWFGFRWLSSIGAAWLR